MWLYHVKQAQDYCPIEVVKDWIYRSLRGEALQTVISIGEGLSVDQILSRLDLKYGTVLSFDELMKVYLNVAQKPQELVTDYIVRLERAQSQLQAEYPEKVDPTTRTSHLRERFYQGLRRELHQRLTPLYESSEVSYLALIKRARMLEKEYPPSPDGISEQARSYKTQFGEVIACMREINKDFQQHTEKAKWKYRNACYACGKEGHWRRKCPT